MHITLSMGASGNTIYIMEKPLRVAFSEISTFTFTIEVVIIIYSLITSFTIIFSTKRN